MRTLNFTCTRLLAQRSRTILFINNILLLNLRSETGIVADYFNKLVVTGYSCQLSDRFSYSLLAYVYAFKEAVLTECIGVEEIARSALLCGKSLSVYELV